MAVRPNASDGLRNVHGRKEMLSKNTRCSKRMHMIFKPFMIHFPFQEDTSVKNKMKVKGLRVVSDHDYLFYPSLGFAQITYLPLGRPRTRACAYCTECSPDRYQVYSHIWNTTIVNTRGYVHAHTSYRLVWYPE